MNTQLLVVTIGQIISVFFMLGLGLFVWLKNKKSFINILFALMSLSLATVFLSFLIAINATSEKFAYFIWSFNLANIPFGLTFSHVTLAVCKKTQEKRKVIKIAYIIGMLIFIACLLFPHQFLPNVEPKMYFNYYLNGGLLYALMLLFFFTVVSCAYFILIKTLLATKGKEEKNKLKYWLLGSTIGFGVGIFGYPLVFNVQIDPLPTMFLFAYNIVFAYAIVKHQLMDISVVIKKAFFYSITIAVISGLIMGVSMLSSWFAEKIPGFQVWMVPLIASIFAFVMGNIFWRKSKEADKLKYEFITIATHKLRTPLTKIKWAIASLPKEIPEECKKIISKIENTNEQTIDLVNELLTVSKSESGQYNYRIELVDIEKMAREKIDETINSLETEISKKNIEITINIEKDLPKINIDKNRIGSVVQMLLENTITYTKDKIWINLKKEGDNIVFSIKDNGIGVSKEDQGHIFLKFFRTHQAYITETEGTGVSLFLSKNIIERHGGKIGVISEGNGEGSEFWFKLKIK